VPPALQAAMRRHAPALPSAKPASKNARGNDGDFASENVHAHSRMQCRRHDDGSAYPGHPRHDACIAACSALPAALLAALMHPSVAVA